MTPLRQRMLEDMSIRNLAENTQLSYVQQVVCFSRYFSRSPEELGHEQVRAYQCHLVKDRHLAASSVGTATAALRFLYRVTLKRDWTSDDIPMPKKPFKLPVVLSPEEVTLFLCVGQQSQAPHDLDDSLRSRTAHLGGHTPVGHRCRQPAHGHSRRSR